VAAAGEERGARDRLQAWSEEAQGPRRKEQGREAGVGNAKLPLLTFVSPTITLVLNVQLICSTEDLAQISTRSP